MITFQNRGLIDLTAITTFGISIKQDDSAIGFFGSGLKYAIAIILRHGGKITVYVGLDKYEFSKRAVDVKGKEFEVIYMNEQQLGFTTRTGINWQLWQAFRELYCNALDEHGDVYSYKATMNEYETTIEVELEEFEALYAQKDSIVLPDKFDVSTPYANILKKRSQIIYYRNIKAMDIQKHSMFTYSIVYKVELIEDRTIKNPWYAPIYIANAICVCEDREVIQRVLLSRKEDWEYDLPLLSYVEHTSKTFIDVLSELMHMDHKDMHPQFDKLCVALFPKVYSKPDIALDEIQQKQYDKALSACMALGYDILDYPVRFKQSLGYGVIGEAKDRTIFISMEAFELGTKMLAGTLLEEYLHLQTGHVDESRGMQNYLFNMIMSLTEKYIIKEPI